jgi:anhydro-N-acetylmuramic acid kinase
MSGTSLDGVDAVLAAWCADESRPVERAFVHCPMPPALRSELLALQSDGERELQRGALAANALARLYADALQQLLRAAGVAARDVRALGAHGQTVRHRPGEFDGNGYTVQLLNGALLAERTGVDVVCDFRARDIAAGGQGAPLVPAFHAQVFAGAEQPDTAVLNIGGIANLTLLPSAGPVRGFDCGPGNTLMDLWCERQGRGHYDADGRLAAAGRVHAALLQQLQSEAYFRRDPPKSTGRDLFNAIWLDAQLAALPAPPTALEDVMATLAELTAATACEALARHAPATRRLLVCGGGAFNAHLLRRLEARAGTAVQVASTASVGMAPDHVEALAFAWLARAFCEKRAGNLPPVTGAAGPRLLGALYPA